MRGNFFAVNRYQWEKVCKLGINAACLYLVMTRGTGPDNISTVWSAHALEKYTNVSRRRAKVAKEKLLKSGHVFLIKGGNHPAYKIKRPKKENSKQDLIWLPNELVTGLEIGVPPLERIRQTGDVFCLRLLVNLYHEHNLIDDCGISRHRVSQEYTRKKIAESGVFIIWGFVKSHKYLPQQITNLEDLGLISFIPHLCESNKPDAEVLHPLIDAYTEDWLLGDTAWKAALSMLSEEYVCEAENYDYVIPALSHMQKINVVGIGVLRYRPKTKMTAAGYANNENATKLWIKAYEDMAEHPEALSRLKNTVNA